MYVVVYNGSVTILHLRVGLALEMLSALIPTGSSYPALPVFRQQAHKGSVPAGPLVLGRAPLKNLRSHWIETDKIVIPIQSEVK